MCTCVVPIVYKSLSSFFFFFQETHCSLFKNEAKSYSCVKILHGSRLQQGQVHQCTAVCSSVRSAKWAVAHSCRSSSGMSSWWDQTDRPTDRQTDCCRSAALARCAGANTNSCLRLNNKAEKRSKSLTHHCFLLYITDWILDAMVKQRRVRAHPCCAAVAPLCSRRGPRQVSCVFSKSYITTLYLLCFIDPTAESYPSII